MGLQWLEAAASEGCDPFPLLGAGEAAPVVLRPVVVPPCAGEMWAYGRESDRGLPG